MVLNLSIFFLGLERGLQTYVQRACHCKELQATKQSRFRAEITSRSYPEPFVNKLTYAYGTGADIGLRKGDDVPIFALA